MEKVFILAFDGDEKEVNDVLDVGAQAMKQQINTEDYKIQWGIRPVAENEKVIMAKREA